MIRKEHQETERIRFEHFLFYDYTGIKHHLETMAEKGWLLKECGRVFWRYEAIPPQKIHFAVTYRPEVTDFDPLPDRNRELYLNLFESAGWIPSAKPCGKRCIQAGSCLFSFAACSFFRFLPESHATRSTFSPAR